MGTGRVPEENLKPDLFRHLLNLNQKFKDNANNDGKHYSCLSDRSVVMRGALMGLDFDL